MSQQTSKKLCAENCPDEKTAINSVNKNNDKKFDSVKNCFQNLYKNKENDNSKTTYAELKSEEEAVCRLGVKKCTAIWWKIFLTIGILLLIVGIGCVVASFINVTKKNKDEENLKIYDLESTSINGLLNCKKAVLKTKYKKQEAIKLIGLILFCVGVLTLAVALLIPSFLYRKPKYQNDRSRKTHSSNKNEKTALTQKEVSMPSSDTQIRIE